MEVYIYTYTYKAYTLLPNTSLYTRVCVPMQVRSLEQQNQVLETEIEAYQNRFQKPTGLRLLYEEQLKELRKLAEQMKVQRVRHGHTFLSYLWRSKDQQSARDCPKRVQANVQCPKCLSIDLNNNVLCNYSPVRCLHLCFMHRLVG